MTTTSIEAFAAKLESYRILPVVTPGTPEETVELAKALARGGIGAIEITLRTAGAMDAIAAVKEAGVDIALGVGTIVSESQVSEVTDIGVDFAVSPGITEKVLAAANSEDLMLLPGIASASELMLGMEYGYELFKLFPAEAVNGRALLKSLGGPFPNIRFCPTGGINPQNAQDYLQLKNVICIGGSWMVPNHLVMENNWSEIENLSAQAIELVH